MSVNWRLSEIFIVIRDKSQSRIAKHSSCNRLLYHKFTTLFANERIFKVGEHLAKLTATLLFVSYATFALYFMSSKMQNSPDKYNNLCNVDKTVTNIVVMMIQAD